MTLGNRPEGLYERGSAFWEASTKGRDFDAAWGALLTEACRVLDRLEKLDAILRGDAYEWVRIEAEFSGRDREVILTLDDALAEARQQQNVFRQIVGSLGLGKSEAAKTGESDLDKFRARVAAARGSAASGPDASAV